MLNLPIPANELKEISKLGDNNQYLNKIQLAKALGITFGTLNNWISAGKVATYDLKVANKLFWLPETVADFIREYRENNNLPIA
jgi:hypothetical protein